MEKLKLEIIDKLLMLSTEIELQKMREFVRDAICRECELEDHHKELFKQWKEDQASA